MSMSRSDQFVRVRHGRGFPSDEACFNEAHVLLNKLRHDRALTYVNGVPRPESAESAIGEFCRGLRRSGRYVSLARIQRDSRLTNDGVVLVAYALLWLWGMPPRNNTVQEAALLACGLSIQRRDRIRISIGNSRGLGRLLYLGDSWGVFPTEELLELVDGTLSDAEARRQKGQIERLPETRPGRKDIGDNEGGDDDGETRGVVREG
jgi:hypothetical protein